MAKVKFTKPHFTKLFIFSLLFIFILGSIYISRTILLDQIYSKANVKSPSPTKEKIPLLTHQDPNYSISFPENYEFYENKIVSTDGFTEEQENTIQLISPPLPDSTGNLSIILTYQKFTTHKEEADTSSTCPELDGLELEQITLGNNKFTHSGLINCGPNEVAFFYILNDDYVYEAKVETTVEEYESKVLPEVLKILETINFNS